MGIYIKIPLFFCLLPLTAGQTLTGFHFMDNNLEERFGPDNGFVTTVTNITEPRQLSFCVWSYAEFDRFGDQIPVIEFYRLNETASPFISLLVKQDAGKSRINIDGVGSWHFKKVSAATERIWNRICVSIDMVGNIIVMYLDGKSDFGEIRMLGPVKTRLTNNTKLPVVVRLGHYYFDNKPTIGMIADVHVWDRTLSDTELKDYSNCIPVKASGNIINDSTLWDVTGNLTMKKEFNQSDVECSDQNKRRTVYVTSTFANFEDANEACDKYGMNSIADNFKSLEAFKRYQEEALKNPAVISECWTGGRLLHWLPFSADVQNKSLKPEDFSHIHTKDPLTIDPWRSSQPNSKEPNCVKTYLSLEYDESWYDFPCENPDLEWASCVACKIPQTLEAQISITLKGLCKTTRFDTTFQVKNDADSGYISYIGDKATTIKYDAKKRTWVMSNVNNPNIIATSTAALKTYVMGTHNWTIRNDIDCEEEETTLLTLSTCKDNEFACSNGLCIDITKRCDSQTDCKDKSDEFGCRRINPDRSYQKFIAPPKYKDQISSKIVIEVSADIMDILDIDEKNSIFQVQFYLHFSWYDGRLTFFDLRNDSGLNALSPLEKELLWIPSLVFENTEDKSTTLVDDEASVTIEKQGDFYLSGLDEHTNRQYYKGTENKIILSRFYNTRFLCTYNFQWYPFDIQNCQLQLTMFGKSGDFSTLEAKILNFFGQRSSKEFVVESYFMRVSETRGKTVLKINVILGRNLMPIALNTYLPSMLLVIISYVTVFFKPFFFEAIVTVNLTTLLVLVTLFVSVSDSLPPTSYIKMVDIYLIFCLLIPFAEVILITIMDYLRMKSEKDSKTDDEAGRMINNHGNMIAVDEASSPVQEQVPDDTNFMYVRKRKPDPHPSVEEVLNANNTIRPVDLINRIEQVEVKTRKTLYSQARKTSNLLKGFQIFAVYGIPTIILMFNAPYMIIGVTHISNAKNEAKIED
ncbi:uncharacterized protein LOC111697908 [Eurytemora carolleeae]|uniref:uncharacterized protein LOC111697908 n=1 Tax=Eurytemora carolleeae TaxID=1294199 RepID=UPI000C76E1E7|nr:uncharacterized protein LOC111697908 [Eurytemora carolleeae]|eukprot:XP_023323855.1 uncharacterized protein LOC111697908 [Eurytemora affinis]